MFSVYVYTFINLKLDFEKYNNYQNLIQRVFLLDAVYQY